MMSIKNQYRRSSHCCDQRLTLTIMLLVLMMGCTLQPNPPTQEVIFPSSTANISASETLLSPTSIPATPTDRTSINLPDFGNLSIGEYLLVQTNIDGDYYLCLISLDKTIVKKFPLDAFVSTSNDGRRLLIIQQSPKPSYSYDFRSKKWSELLIDRECFSASWSLDKQYIALDCVNDGVLEIYIFDTTSGSMLKVTDCLEKGHACGSPSWSFDGNWLAYYRDDERSGVHPSGVYIFNTKCIENNSCMSKQIGLIESKSNPVWSVDNELSLMRNGQIQFLKLENSKLDQKGSFNAGLTGSTDLVYSPDGEYLIYTSNAVTLKIYSRSLGVSETLFNAKDTIRVNGWIVIQ